MPFFFGIDNFPDTSRGNSVDIWVHPIIRCGQCGFSAIARPAALARSLDLMLTPANFPLSRYLYLCMVINTQAEKLNVFYWWTSLKAYFSKQFPNFFVAASTPTDGNLLGYSKSIGQQLQEIEQYFAMEAPPVCYMFKDIFLIFSANLLPICQKISPILQCV